MEVDTAVVLAAGEGTRLRPLTQNRPKPMLPAGNRPILEHVFDALVDAGVERLVTVIGYKRDRVQDYFGPTYRGVPITYVTQHKQLGSGHALLQARSVVDDPMIVVNGDRLIDAPTVEAVADMFSKTDGPTISVVEHQDVSQYGAVELHDGVISDLIEKPREDDYRLINGGVYAFSAEIFDLIEETPRQAGELALTDTLADYIEHAQIYGVEVGGLWVDATYPWDLLTVAQEVLTRGRLETNLQCDQVWTADSAQIHAEAVLQGPVAVGPDCEIGPQAVIGPDTVLGANVTVGANTVIQRSVLDADTRVNSGSTLLDTVTGQDVHISSGSIVPSGPADVQVGSTVFEDQQLGAVIADRVDIGSSVTIIPGSLIGPNATLTDGLTVRGNVSARTEVTH